MSGQGLLNPRRFLATLVLLTLSGIARGQAIPDTAHAQRPKTACPKLKSPIEILPSGPAPSPDSESLRIKRVDSLRVLLSGSEALLPFVRPLFFGVSYTPTLADWI